MQRQSGVRYCHDRKAKKGIDLSDEWKKKKKKKNLLNTEKMKKLLCSDKVLPPTSWKIMYQMFCGLKRD